MTRNRILAALLAAGLIAVPATAAPAKPVKKKSQTVKVSRGATTLSLDAGTAQALTGLGLTVSPLMPAKADGLDFAFPVTTGKLNAKTYAGQIRHSGGIRLTNGTTTVDLRNFRINIDAQPDLTARVGDARLSIADLDLSKAEIAVKGRKVSIGNVGVALSAGAADALNKAFGTDALTGGTTLGTASVKTRIVGVHR